MSDILTAALFGACAALLGGWALVRPDTRLRDLVMERPADPGTVKVPRRWATYAAVAALGLSLGFPLSRPLKGSLWAVVLGGCLSIARGLQAERRRVAEFRAEWPALLEGMAVAVMSGLDMRSAFVTAARRVTGALKPEIEKASARLEGGMQFGQALESLAKAGVPGAERLRSLLLQCDVLGTPVADTLQSLALEAVTVERQEAERRYNALPLKLSVITVGLLLPPVLIVSIAPNILVFLNSRW